VNRAASGVSTKGGAKFSWTHPQRIANFRCGQGGARLAASQLGRGWFLFVFRVRYLDHVHSHSEPR
jgi:hypothetical protein